MSYITFVVKGNAARAAQAVKARGIPAVLLHESTNGKDTVFRCEPWARQTVAQWFGEVPPLIPGYGYPDGTCLIYSSHEE